MSEQMEQVIAVINFSWESKKFYEKWLGDKDVNYINELKGPCLNTGSYQSPYASELLAIIAIIRDDVRYIGNIEIREAIYREYA